MNDIRWKRIVSKSFCCGYNSTGVNRHPLVRTKDLNNKLHLPDGIMRYCVKLEK